MTYYSCLGRMLFERAPRMQCAGRGTAGVGWRCHLSTPVPAEPCIPTGSGFLAPQALTKLHITRKEEKFSLFSWGIYKFHGDYPACITNFFYSFTFKKWLNFRTHEKCHIGMFSFFKTVNSVDNTLESVAELDLPLGHTSGMGLYDVLGFLIYKRGSPQLTLEWLWKLDEVMDEMY